MRTGTRFFARTLLPLLTLLGLCSNAYSQSLTSKCVFEYQDRPYQWLRTNATLEFTHINDAGQVIGEYNDFDRPIIYFYDSESFFGRSIIAYWQYDSPRPDLMRILPVFFNNDGSLFVNVFLRSLPDDAPEGAQVYYYSNDFVLKWDLEDGAVDLADLVGGISGYGDIGQSTVLANSTTLLVEAKTNDPTLPWGPQTSRGLPFPDRPAQMHITTDMLDAITQQCGSAPSFDTSTPSSRNNNANLEFITYRDIVRIAHANLGHSVSHWWYDTGIYYGNTGQLGDDLNFRVAIDNYGALDVYSLRTSLEVTNAVTAEVLEINEGFDPAPTSVDAGEFSDYFYFYTRPLKPGTYSIQVVTRGLDEFNASFERRSTPRTLTIESSEPQLKADIRFTDGRERSVIGEFETVGITLNVSTTDGNNPIDNIVFTDLFGGAPNLDIVSAPEIPPEGFSLAPNSSRSLNWQVKPNSGGNWRLSTTVSGRNAAGIPVSDSDSLTGKIVSEDLVVEVAISPEGEITQDETLNSDPEPIEFTVDAAVCNNTGKAITQVRLNSLSVKSHTPYPIYVDKISGPAPLTDYEIGTLQKYSCMPIEQSKFVATDDGYIEVDAMATGLSEVGAELVDFDEKLLKIKPKYYLQVSPELINPEAGSAIDAGLAIRIGGRVKNLSNTHTLEMGPLYAVLQGNAGAQSFAWDTSGTLPEAFVLPQFPMRIEPGGERDFSIRATTSASDPRHDGTGEGKPTGGTRAYVNLVPWAIAEDPEGERTQIKSESSGTYTVPDQLKNVAGDLQLVVSINDGIAIPVANSAAIAAGVTLGAMQATFNMGMELLKAPYTLLNGFASMLNATIEYQYRLWDSFTEEEKALFVEDVGLLAGTILLRHYEMAAEIDPQQLLAQVNAVVLQQMTEMAEEWELGDYTTVATTYSRYSTSLIGEVAFPVALWKLGKYQKAQQVLQRGQNARNARNAALLRSADVGEDFVDLRKIEQILLTGEAGVEATVSVITRLFGYTPEEIGRLQAALDRFPGLMMTTRSKSARSVFWKEIFNAVLKPEALKAKGVNWMDEVLGYPPIEGYSSVGAMIFKKPDFMVLAEQSGRTWGEEILSFLASKNIHPGDAMYDQAVERLLLRAEEWVKYEKTYKKADELGYLDLTFDTAFNSVNDGTAAFIRRTSTNEIPLGAKNHVGFRMRKVSSADSPFETYVLEMRDKQGVFRPVTGDVDNTGFTRTDGTALDELLHAKVLDHFYGQGLIEHGDSATAKVGIGGLRFIEKQAEGTGGAQELVLQWKAGEPGPRLVRFNKDKSVWNSPRDFRLHYDGGFVDAGNSIPQQGPKPPITIPAAPPQSLPAPDRIAQSISSPNFDGSPNVGRCRLFYSDDEGAASVIMGSSGRLSNVGPDGTITPSELHEVCFGDGGVVSFSIAPSTMISEEVTAGTAILPVLDNGSAATTTGTSTVDGFEAGQTVIIGADTDHAEIRRIVGLGSIELDRPLDFAHSPGEVVVVVEQAQPPELEQDDVDSFDRFLDAITGLDGATHYADGLLEYSVGGIGTRLLLGETVPTAGSGATGLEIDGDGRLTFHTDNGQSVSAFPGLLDPDVLAQVMAELDLVINQNGAGRIVAGGEFNTGPLLLSMMPALVLTDAAPDAQNGLTELANPEVPNQTLLNLVSDVSGTPRQQILYPAPIDWRNLQTTLLSIPGVDGVTLSLEGLVTITLGGDSHIGMMDYQVQRATGGLGDTTIEIGSDRNDDGLPDILVTYPDGNQQVMYYLGMR